jgi:uroporphyrinogen decarboxylase
VFGKIGGPYIRSSFVRGAQEYMYDIAGDPGFVKELAGRITEHVLDIAKEELRRGDLYDSGIWIYDDMAYNNASIMSPKSFYDIYYPCYVHLVRELKLSGAKKVILHSDGNIVDLLDMLIDTGIDGINPVEPKAGMNIKKLKRKYGKKLAYIGGMCNSVVLVNGPHESIVKQAREIIDEAQDGGIVIGSHSIGPDISVDNYLACCILLYLD